MSRNFNTFNQKTNHAGSNSGRRSIFLRWLFYSLSLLVFYMIMAGGFFRDWQPILIIPLAIAVSMRQSEISAAIFGAVCGLVIDIAAGKLFGFTGIWLLPGCLSASLLVSHLIKINLLNFLWLNAAVCAFMASADYFFRYVLFNVDNSYYALTDYIIPSHLSAVILSPLVYFGVKFVTVKFSSDEYAGLSLFHRDDRDDED